MQLIRSHYFLWFCPLFLLLFLFGIYCFRLQVTQIQNIYNLDYKKSNFDYRLAQRLSELMQ